ncbi:uncharacterized protein LDX57_003263 [Aspergillus melleus]|uniref:uncharacterized protein n=1 Tax=Aspergillus melleus TaxID=138277 RepID=UPI001E8DF4F4|nr:uncharacterized protein LDX57_003263 [Aspergillus melleus]KAH8425512.1 hypothetical protein LDX57_003263 [Aspergillus melleus]
MNVFPDRPSLITLEARPRSHDSAVIAILLEELRLPYELHLTDSHVPQVPHLTDTHSNGAQIGLSDVVSIASYLVAQYDKEQRAISYRNGTKEAAEIQGWVGLLSERSKTPAQAQAQRKAQTRRSSPSDDAQARESRVQVVRKMLHLYLLMEGRLQDRKSGGYLVGRKW